MLTLQAPSPRPAEAMEARVMSVRVEQTGAVGTVIIDRPEKKNAVDGHTASALAAWRLTGRIRSNHGSRCPAARA